MIPKTMNINTRVDAIDYFEIDALADRLKISKSELMRLSYRGELHKRMTYMDLSNDELKELYNRLDVMVDRLGKTQNELRRIGVNINQLTKLSRQEGKVELGDELSDDELLGYFANWQREQEWQAFKKSGAKIASHELEI